MKKVNRVLLPTAITVLLISGNIAMAQKHELKTNVLGAIFNQFGLTYEYVLDDNMGIVGSVAYFTPPSSFSYDYRAFSIAPEFRYYFNPDDDADGFFVGGYLKYRNTNADEYLTYYPDPNDPNSEEVTVAQKTNGLALGITTGNKWVTRSGFMFEIWGGVGRYLFDATTYTNGYNPDEFNQLIDDLPSWDVRIGGSLGWRFGR